jgi:hypothetical protein
MDEILKDVQVLAAHHAFRSALPDKAPAFDEARKDLERVARDSPSVSNALFEAADTTSNVNHGRDQINHTGGGTLNNVHRAQFLAQGVQNFGRWPPQETSG